MVAISLYRGNLHRVPDLPRQWLRPTPKISLKDFKVLLDRRSRALSRLRSSATAVAPTLNNLNPDSEQDDIPKEKPQKLDLPKVADNEETEVNFNPVGTRDVLPEEKIEAPVNPNSEACKVDATTDKEKRKQEVEEKLQVLSERKHNLVQLLKQILNAEEELRRRSSMQGAALRPSLPLHVDVTNDSGSMSTQITPPLGSNSTIIAHLEGVDADDSFNQNIHSRNSFPTSSISPSSESLHRMHFNAVPHPSRATLGVASSPSRFAPTGQQANVVSVPTVSVTGTNYVASSPSPVGSGGISVFRDVRLPSPWN